ncbi:MAG: secretin N-terminal domain-containing protein [Pirellulales bacterium]
MKLAAIYLLAIAAWFCQATSASAQANTDNAISYPHKNARAEQVVPIIQQLFGTNLHLAADQRVNAVIVIGKPADLQIAGMLVERLDLPPAEAANTVLVELNESLQHKQLDSTLEQLAKSLNLNIIQAKQQQTHILIQGPVASRTQFQQLLTQFGQKVAELERSESRILRVAVLRSRDHETTSIHGDTAAQALLDKVKKLGFGQFELTGQCMVRCKVGPQKHVFETEGTLSGSVPFKLTGNARLGENNDAFRVELSLNIYRDHHRGKHKDHHGKHRDDEGKLRAALHGAASMPLNSWTLIGSTLIDGESLLVLAQMLPATLN